MTAFCSLSPPACLTRALPESRINTYIGKGDSTSVPVLKGVLSSPHGAEKVHPLPPHWSDSDLGKDGRGGHREQGDCHQLLHTEQGLSTQQAQPTTVL